MQLQQLDAKTLFFIKKGIATLLIGFLKQSFAFQHGTKRIRRDINFGPVQVLGKDRVRDRSQGQHKLAQCGIVAPKLQTKLHVQTLGYTIFPGLHDAEPFYGQPVVLSTDSIASYKKPVVQTIVQVQPHAMYMQTEWRNNQTIEEGPITLHCTSSISVRVN